MRRFAPLLLILAVVFFLVPLLTRSHKGSLSAKEKATRALSAIARIDAAERVYTGARGRYTSHLADLVTRSKGLGDDLATGLTVELDVSSDGHTYLAQVAGEFLGLVRARTGPKLSTDTCVVLKKASGVKCPVAAPRVK